MPDYKKMYFQLAAEVASAVELLIQAQRQGENSYIEDDAPPFILDRATNGRSDED